MKEITDKVIRSHIAKAIQCLDVGNVIGMKACLASVILYAAVEHRELIDLPHYGDLGVSNGAGGLLVLRVTEKV